MSDDNGLFERWVQVSPTACSLTSAFILDTRGPCSKDNNINAVNINGEQRQKGATEEKIQEKDLEIDIFQ